LNLKSGSKFLGIGVSVVTFLVFAIIYGPENLFRTFVSLPPYFLLFFLAALSFHILSFIFWSLRIVVLSRANGFKISFSKSFIVVMSSLFAASITPGYVGGEPIRIKKLNDYGVPVGSATAIALGERGFDSIFFVIIFAFVILSGLEILTGQLRLYAIIGIIVLGIFLIFLLLSMGAHTLMRKAMGWLERVVKRFERKGKNYEEALPKVFAQVEAYSSSTRRIFLKNPVVLTAGVAITALLWLSDFTVPTVLLIGFGVSPNLLYVIFIQVILVLVSLIPLTPSSAGIMEVLMIATFSIFLPHSSLIAFVIIWRFITFYFNLAIGSLGFHRIVAK
jgi:uncharacterized protein (TIRG00374 family)